MCAHFALISRICSSFGLDCLTVLFEFSVYMFLNGAEPVCLHAVSMVENHFAWCSVQQGAKQQKSHLITETHTLLILLRLPVFVFCNREIITFSFPVYYVWGGLPVHKDLGNC